MGVETILLAVTAATAVVGGVSAQDQARRANNEKDAARNAAKAREQQLTDEAAAKATEAKKAESAGSRAGFGSAIASAFSSRPSSYNATGFNNNLVREDNIGRGGLFGN